MRWHRCFTARRSAPPAWKPAVAVGRLGAMSGPLLAGKMLALGTGTVGVMAASAPGILLAGLAVFILMSRKSQMPIPASGA